ncbi:flagellar motor protein MotB [Pigmentiphaga sp.]|uniref:flagellar motor protein MotB n=1 Tax=Pigmentiphaga sp. TaxID=1977564 RepID=UPI00128CFBEF|nr:flagellar motor protein MotB [Pigmentiphaga sp.]MPS30400.1 flagellar motor protein MotB [Alcaligenaceae bacterium SAGV5]MPS50361.1 flagellar motor protein MotB [Alcaligenaceae bacterium SAGV3]MPT57467.1 flagellar motor protein MotB [Alcaligenaceae bacterium]
MAGKDGVVPIIIRRSRKRAGKPHGAGMWKIAYADFVTAMMAFFLLMWLLTTSAQADLDGISEYFRTPLRVAVTSGSVAGDPVSVLTGGQHLSPRVTPQRRASDDEQEARERRKLEGLKSELESLIFTQPTLTQFKDQILLDFTDEGLRIQIVDEKNRPMFDTGKTVLKDYSRVILDELARVLNGVENKISISGHTDSAPYAGGTGGYSNWELSADRANAARREMLTAGMQEGKALRVVGLSDSVPFNRADVKAAENRRISIVVLNRRSEEFLKKGGVYVDVPAIPGRLNDGTPLRVSVLESQ